MGRDQLMAGSLALLLAAAPEQPTSRATIEAIGVTALRVERVASITEGRSEVRTEPGRDFVKVTLGITIKEKKATDGGIMWEGAPGAVYYGREGREELVATALRQAQRMWQFEVGDASGKKVGRALANWVFTDTRARRLWFYADLPATTSVGVLLVQGTPLSPKALTPGPEATR